jgi:uncharacterized protein involved in response to NO
MALIQIESNKPSPTGIPVLRLGFRPFFLLAGLAAVALILYWLFIFFKAGTTLVYASVHWHAHEMIFGYSVAVIAGFLLTAEKNWTGVQTPQGIWLGGLALLWLAGRVVSLLTVPVWMVASIDLLFIPILAIVLLIPLLKTRQYQHMIFVVIAFALFIANLLFHLDYLLPEFQTAALGIRLGWLIILLLITVMGGRVIPFFIERGTGQIGQTRSYKSLELAGFVSLLIWMGYSLLSSSSLILAVLAIVAGLIQALRLWGWYLHALWRHPMLWILLVGYSWIPIGLLLFAYASYSGTNNSSAVHAFTAGAIGILTIGMMARVSLGHTGRNIEASPLIIVAFVCVVLGALLRVIGSLSHFEIISKYYLLIVSSAGILWASGFLLFLVVFIPILLKSRVDNRPG